MQFGSVSAMPFTNYGTVTRSTSAGLAELEFEFINNGDLNINTGTLLLLAGGSMPSGGSVSSVP